MVAATRMAISCATPCQANFSAKTMSPTRPAMIWGRRQATPRISLAKVRGRRGHRCRSLAQLLSPPKARTRAIASRIVCTHRLLPVASSRNIDAPAAWPTSWGQKETVQTCPRAPPAARSLRALPQTDSRPFIRIPRTGSVRALAVMSGRQFGSKAMHSKPQDWRAGPKLNKCCLLEFVGSRGCGFLYCFEAFGGRKKCSAESNDAQ